MKVHVKSGWVMKSIQSGLTDKNVWKEREGSAMIPTEGKAVIREKGMRGK